MKKALRLLTLAAILCISNPYPMYGFEDNTLTVNECPHNSTVPVDGSYVDSYSYSQFIIPAGDLSTISGTTLNSLTFYSSSASVDWGDAEFEVYMLEVDYTSFSSETLVDWTSMTKVRNAASLGISGNQMVVTLTTPYQYQGGNLMIGIKQTTSGTYVYAEFYGASAGALASLGGYDSYVYRYNFRPRVTFSHTPTCPKPLNPTASSVTNNSASLSWTAGDSENEWVLQYGTDNTFADLLLYTEVDVSTTPSQSITGLTNHTQYYFRVKADCGGGDESEWSAVQTFTTHNPCAAVSNLEVSAITETGATLTWTGGSGTYNVQYKTALADDWTSLVTNTTSLTRSMTGLTPGTSYHVRVQSDCGSDGESSWTYEMFTTSAFSKDITANQWYALSSPVHDNGDNEAFAGVENLTSGTYDLMRWNEANGTWQTSKPAVFNSFIRGRGYIYRRSDAATLSYFGQRNTGNLQSDTLYADCPDNALKGFNLVGNPYTKAYTPTVDYYRLNPNGTWTVHEYGTGSVAVAEGFFVKVASMGFYDFTEPSGAKGAGSTAATTLAFTVSNDEFTDIAYARFGAGEGLPKFAHLNPAAPALSIPQEDRHYAIANLSESVESFPLAFSGTGKYTLTVDNTAAYGYLHLIDHATGADIDLLRTAGYTFNVTGNSDDRFLVKLKPDGDETSFVRVSGNLIIVDGEGELQVYDVMGRQLGNAQVNGTTTLDRSSLGIVSTGVYVLRLNGESQKIVVK
ncbi:MAG: fibronectin type III domain-containing protein [Bacteroidales bacterium]|nr:fibronectin type III domain-containing protein [Bacteroidales bacterium]